MGEERADVSCHTLSLMEGPMLVRWGSHWLTPGPPISLSTKRIGVGGWERKNVYARNRERRSRVILRGESGEREKVKKGKKGATCHLLPAYEKTHTPSSCDLKSEHI